MNKPWVWVDFNSINAKDRLWLSCVGTKEDLARQQIELRDGLELTLYQDDEDGEGRPQLIVVQGVVERSVEENCWVAKVDWDGLRYIPIEQVKLIHETNGTTHSLMLPTKS